MMDFDDAPNWFKSFIAALVLGVMFAIFVTGAVALISFNYWVAVPCLFVVAWFICWIRI